jgi:hypothetical protein
MFFAWVGAIAGLILMAVILVRVEGNAWMVGLIFPAVGAAIGLQLFFGTSKRSIVQSFLFALPTSVIAYLIWSLAARFIPGSNLSIGRIALALLLVLLISIGAMFGGRRAKK